MGFLDKAKEQASALAGKASDGINQGQEKLNEAQAARKANGLLEKLGAWTWAKEHGRALDLADPELERVRAALVAHEAEHGAIEAPVSPAEDDDGRPSQAPAPPPPVPPGPVDGPPPPEAAPPPVPPGPVDGPPPGPAGSPPPPPT